MGIINPPTQYADDRNLAARQRLWSFQDRPFDLVRWVIDLAGPAARDRVLDVGCGNGLYLRALAELDVTAVGWDLSYGMLSSARPHPMLVNGDVTRLSFRDSSFDVVLAPHMLYHVPDRVAAARELRRVLRQGGSCVVVTNGVGHLRSLRALVETAVGRATPGWEWSNPSTHTFSLENGREVLANAFGSVEIVRATSAAPVRIKEASVAADYIASVADHYQHEVDRPWSDVVDEVRAGIQAVIDADGEFVVGGETGAFVCR